jgi:hypothetical protein
MGLNEYLVDTLIAERLREAREHAVHHHRLAGARYGVEASSWIRRWRSWRPASRSFGVAPRTSEPRDCGG